MPKKSQDHVHRLIRSMTSAEKRYFKLFGRKEPEGETGLHILFDAIAAMEVYDEAKLLRKFEHEAFARHFSITKRRLYETILRSLDSFHADSSLDVRLHRLLHHVGILYQRALYDDAWKALQSVRRPAEQHERTHILLAVMEWERRLIECRNYADVDEAGLAVRASVDREILKGIEQVNTLWNLKSTLLLQLYQQGQVRDPKALSAIAQLLQHPTLRDPNALTTAKAKFLFHHLHGAAAFARGDTAACYEHLTTNLALLNTERDRFMDEHNLVLGVMSNLIYVCIQAGRYTEAFTHLRSFRTLPSQWNMPESDDLDLKLFSTSTSLELSMHMRLGDFDRALELVPVVERGLGKYTQRMGPLRKAGFRYQVAYAYFGANQFERSFRWIQNLLNGSRADDRSDAVCAGRLLQLITLLELGKHDLIPYALRNTERYLRLHGRKNRFEPLLLALVRSLVKTRSEAARQALLLAFHAAVTPLANDPMEHAVFDHFDPIAWAESKMSGQAFALLVKKRAAGLATAA